MLIAKSLCIIVEIGCHLPVNGKNIFLALAYVIILVPTLLKKLLQFSTLKQNTLYFFLKIIKSHLVQSQLINLIIIL